jgi:hypothetical protein
MLAVIWAILYFCGPWLFLSFVFAVIITVLLKKN